MHTVSCRVFNVRALSKRNDGWLADTEVHHSARRVHGHVPLVIVVDLYPCFQLSPWMSCFGMNKGASLRGFFKLNSIFGTQSVNDRAVIIGMGYVSY